MITSQDGLTTFYRSPDDDIKDVLDRLPIAAARSIHAEIYGFTDLQLVDAMNAAAERGCQNYVMNDHSQSLGPKDHAALLALVHWSPNNHVKVVESLTGAIDHLKVFMVDVDGPPAPTTCVLAGSYNFSDGAEKQDNFAFLSKDPAILGFFKAKFDEDWAKNEQRPEWQPMGAPTPAPVVVAGVPVA